MSPKRVHRARPLRPPRRPRDASPDDIKRAYRRKAREHHPDAGGDEEAFKQITHAYQVLSDPQKRARYDRFGDDGTPSSRGAGGPFFGAGFGGIGDVIDAFFGSAFSRRWRSRAAALPAGPRRARPGGAELEDVATGVQHEVEIEVASTCDVCDGAGLGVGRRARVACAPAGAPGRSSGWCAPPSGRWPPPVRAPSAPGRAVTVSDPCRRLRGEGRRVERRTLTIEVPPGVDDGDRLRVSGAGEAGRRGAPAGDLYVEVRVAPHEVFERHGHDLLADVSVPSPRRRSAAR
jgi:molecular chaperone DnaJ